MNNNYQIKNIDGSLFVVLLDNDDKSKFTKVVQITSGGNLIPYNQTEIIGWTRISENDKKNSLEEKEDFVKRVAKNVNKFLAVFSACCLVVIFILSAVLIFKDSPASDAETPQGEKIKNTKDADHVSSKPAGQSDDRKPSEKKNLYNVGSTVTFGSYEQDDVKSNGKEQIAWQVLQIKGGKALLITKKGLDAHRFNSSEGGNDFEKSEIRKWLNNDFLNSAFNESERMKIEKQNGNYVSLLTKEEADKLFENAEKRIAYPTDFAKTKGAWSCSKKECKGESTGAGYWWLRSKGSKRESAPRVSSGGVLSFESKIDQTDGMVRPVIWVKID